MPANKKLLHILLQDTPEPEKYEYPGGGGSVQPLPSRARVPHAQHLLESLDRARIDARAVKKAVEAWAVPAKKGTHLELESEPGFDLELKSLDSRSPKGTQLVTVRESRDGNATLATVFVPEGQLKLFETKIRKYETEDTDRGHPRHQKLIEKISHIRLARLRSFWSDESDLFPSPDESIWWEVWLRTPDEGYSWESHTRSASG